MAPLHNGCNAHVGGHAIRAVLGRRGAKGAAFAWQCTTCDMHVVQVTPWAKALNRAIAPHIEHGFLDNIELDILAQESRHAARAIDSKQ